MNLKSALFAVVLVLATSANAGMAAVMPKGFKCANGTVLKKDDICPRTPEKNCPQPSIHLPDGSCRKFEPSELFCPAGAVLDTERGVCMIITPMPSPKAPARDPMKHI